MTQTFVLHGLPFLERVLRPEDESGPLFRESALMVHIDTLCHILFEVNSSVPFSPSQLRAFFQFGPQTTVFLGENGDLDVSTPRESGERSEVRRRN